MKKYWLYLEPYILIFLQKREFLVYNCINYESKLFQRSSNLGNIISQLVLLENMYCLELNEDEISEKEVEAFINYIISSFSGDLIRSDKIKKPAIFYPALKIYGRKYDFKTTGYQYDSKGIDFSLNEVFIYIGGDNPSSSLADIEVYKQFDFCKKTEGQHLPYEKLTVILNSLRSWDIQNLNILGGNIFTYPDLEILINELAKLQFTIRVYSHYKDIPKNKHCLTFLKANRFILKILIDAPIFYGRLDEIFHFLSDNNCKFELIFAVTSIIEYRKAAFIVNKYNLEQFEIKPVFTGANIKFFRKYVFLSKEDVLTIKATQQEIYLKQTMNIFHFGRIRIMTDGRVYSDLNMSPLGDVGTPLVDMLNVEMCEPRSWLRVRNQKPCKSCVYQWLCPSPSGYEYAIGKSNLCMVKNGLDL
jgi:pseudo-rSAM protein